MGASVLLPANAVPVIRGTSKTLLLTVTDSNQAPVDLTGATVYMTVKRDPLDTVPLIFKSSTNAAQAQIVTPLAGQAEIYLDPADTQNMEIGYYVFDVWVVLASGKRYVVVQQTIFDVQPGVTVLPLS